MATDLRQLIGSTAVSLGISPLDLATAISYETGGTFDPLKRGPTTKWGQHRGLIQFGEPQAQKYGVDWNNPIESQLGPGKAVARYLTDAGVKPGMGMMDIYSAINAGGVGLYNRSDEAAGGAPGTVADKVNNQMAGHRAKAEQMFGGGPGKLGGDSMVARDFDPQVAAQTNTPGSPPSFPFGFPGAQLPPLPPGVADYANDDKDKKGPLSTIAAALSAVPNAPAPNLGGGGDANASGNLLNKALSNPTIASILMDKRLGGLLRG